MYRLTMAKRKHQKKHNADEIKALSKEELQNMKLKFSIKVPKEEFDEIAKVLMGISIDKKKD